MTPKTTLLTFEQRCRLSEECLPDAPYRKMLRALHDEMLAKLSADHEDALEVLQALDSGQWKIERCRPFAYATDKANKAISWLVERAAEPYESKGGARRWGGATAIKALRKGKSAFGIKDRS